MRLGAINDGHVNRFIRDLQAKQTRSKKPLSNRRINMVISRLRDIFATAYRRKLIAENPMLHVENLRETKSEVDPFDLDETLRIIVAARGWERALLTVLLFTGMRPGEALALRLKAIDEDHNLIRVRETVNRRYGFGPPKTPGSERDVDMIGQVREALLEQRRRVHEALLKRGARAQVDLDHALLFPSESGTAIDLANFRARKWPRILRDASVRPRTLRQCRHTFARLLLERGDVGTPQKVADQLGHTSLEMVFRVYGRWMQRPQSAALASLERAISVTHPSPKSGGETAARRGK